MWYREVSEVIGYVVQRSVWSHRLCGTEKCVKLYTLWYREVCEVIYFVVQRSV